MGRGFVSVDGVCVCVVGQEGEKDTKADTV